MSDDRREVVVVVGNGVVGHRFCELLRAADPAGERRLVVFGEEPRAAYDRVHLSAYFSGRTPEDLALVEPGWYAAHDVDLRVGQPVAAIDRGTRTVVTTRGARQPYDRLVLATGSAPFVPPLPGIEQAGVFVYRTIEDLQRIEAWGRGAARAAVIGGGLLGLEAAKATRDMRLETWVVEFASRLMPRQLDDAAGTMLRRRIEALGVHVRLDARTERVLGDGRVTGLGFADGTTLPIDMLVVSAGIRPRDELARASGLDVGARGGIVVDDRLCTGDPVVFAIGECALVGGMVYGLVAPGFAMAEVLAANLCGADRRFAGGDLSTKLKLLGVDVASFGDPMPADDDTTAVVFEDHRAGVCQKLVLSGDGRRLRGGMLVGDASRYMTLAALCREGGAIPERPAALLFGDGAGSAAADAGALADEAQICSCNDVTKGALRAAIDAGTHTLGGLKTCTKAGTGCGGCLPFVEQILGLELARSGRTVERHLCEHFPHTRQELFQIAKIRRITGFAELLAAAGRGNGCEICKPAAASIFASTSHRPILDQATIQDTNDRFLANIQRGGTYSVIPRVPGGEITPEQLIVLGHVARQYDLYCKITGGQRIDLLGARVEQLPDIWEALVAAGFESGHAYGKALRTVKSCIGSTWCRYGVQDSTGLAIRLEMRYRGIRAPHKVKAAVSGCIRECAEAQGKDFGIIATEKGWNLYLGGNGGASPRHADLFATDLDEATLVAYIDRFFMYYIHTADRLQRTARWIEQLDGGIAYLKRVIIDDALGICAQLEADMAALVGGYECEWTAVVRDPARRATFRPFVNSPASDDSPRFVRERGQKRPATWPTPVTRDMLPPRAAPTNGHDARDDGAFWVRVAAVGDTPSDGGSTVKYGETQIALFNFASRGHWFATQNVCPHRRDMVLARGILGDQGGEAKVACPLHKRTFSLESGDGLSDPTFAIETYPVEIRGDEVWVRLPPPEVLARRLPCAAASPPAGVAPQRVALLPPPAGPLPDAVSPSAASR